MHHYDDPKVSWFTNPLMHIRCIKCGTLDRWMRAYITKGPDEMIEWTCTGCYFSFTTPTYEQLCKKEGYI